MTLRIGLSIEITAEMSDMIWTLFQVRLGPFFHDVQDRIEFPLVVVDFWEFPKLGMPRPVEE
jgi:hypothetical protein